MKPLLEPGGTRALQAFARPGTLIGLDFDGTLAPIVARPADARMLPSTRELLARLCRRYPVLVLSGRARADVLQRLGGTDPLEVIGSHGLDTFGAVAARVAERMAQWRATLAERLRALAGITIEDKRLSLAVHFRDAPDADVAQKSIEAVVAELPGARILGGKKVVNVVPVEAPDKGQALMAACERSGSNRALYVGDDETDEDVFALRQPAKLLTVRVGAVAGSAAEYFIAEQGDIDAVLRVLLGESIA